MGLLTNSRNHFLRHLPKSWNGSLELDSVSKRPQLCCSVVLVHTALSTMKQVTCNRRQDHVHN